MRFDNINSPINVHNEWDPIEEIIVGKADFARVPSDLGITAVTQAAHDVYEEMKPKAFPQKIVEETEEDLAIFVEELEKLDIRVRRPTPIDYADQVRTPFWEAGYYFSYCPRDILLTVGDSIIETPNIFRSRFFDPWAYKDILVEYLEGGARWLSAPRPALRDDVYNLDRSKGSAIRESEPLFDAANVIRAGEDLFYLVSDSGNELGLLWLKSILGDRYNIHACRGLYSSVHIDTTLVLLRPGLVLANPSRVNHNNLPEALRKWDIMYAPEMKVSSYNDLPSMSSEWFGMNILMLSEDHAVVDAHQTDLIRMLNSVGIETTPLKLRHGRALGGGFHCVTLDVRRKGTLQSYF